MNGLRQSFNILMSKHKKVHEKMDQEIRLNAPEPVPAVNRCGTCGEPLTDGYYNTLTCENDCPTLKGWPGCSKVEEML